MNLHFMFSLGIMVFKAGRPHGPSVQVFSPDLLLSISVLPLLRGGPRRGALLTISTDSFASSATYCAVVSPSPCTLSRET